MDIFPFYIPSWLMYNGNSYSSLQALQVGVEEKA